MRPTVSLSFRAEPELAIRLKALQIKLGLPSVSETVRQLVEDGLHRHNGKVQKKDEKARIGG